MGTVSVFALVAVILATWKDNYVIGGLLIIVSPVLVSSTSKSAARELAVKMRSVITRNRALPGLEATESDQSEQ